VISKKDPQKVKAADV